MTYTARERRRIVDAEYRRTYELKRLRGIPTSPVSAAPAVDLLRRLTKLGWSHEALSRITGLSDTALLDIRAGSVHTIHRATARAIASLPYSLNVPAIVPDQCFVPSLGATRRIQALMRLGWTHKGMQDEYGFDTTHFARGTYHQTLARKWRAVDDMYEAICMTHGPSEKTRTYARNRRWHAPLAWHDIDDPAERPRIGRHTRTLDGVVDPVVVDQLIAGERVESTRGEKLEAMRRWIAAGNSARSLARAHGWQEGRYVVRGDDEEDAA